MEIAKTRADGCARGLKYFTGRTCPECGTMTRWVADGRCIRRRSHMSPESRAKERLYDIRRRLRDNRLRERQAEWYRKRYAEDPQFARRAIVRARRSYENMSGVDWNRYLLRKRRQHALKRQAKRHAALAEEFEV